MTRTTKHALLMGLFLLLSVSASVAGSKKVTLCHYPPGNPGNPTTITVSERAKDTHMRHGDTLGECPVPEPSTPGGNDDSGGNADTLPTVAPAIAVCDDRVNETGRVVNINRTGRPSVIKVQCD